MFQDLRFLTKWIVCKRAGKGASELKEKLNHNAVLMQIPIGAEENFAGVVDLVTKKASTLMVTMGNVRMEECPADLVD